MLLKGAYCVGEHFVALQSCYVFSLARIGLGTLIGITVEVNSMMNPVFGNNFLATDANLIFLSKIDKDFKSVIENNFFHFFMRFQKSVLSWNFQKFNNCYCLPFPICT